MLIANGTYYETEHVCRAAQIGTPKYGVCTGSEQHQW